MRSVAFAICCSLVLSLASSAVSTAAEPELPAADQLPAQAGLPDPLVMLDGTKIATKEDWAAKRRPELLRLFQHYMYGYFPPKPDKIEATPERVDTKYFGGKATKKEVVIRFGPAGCPPISLLVVTPNGKTPAPCFVGMNFNGNHTVLKDPNIALPTSWMRPGPGVENNKASDAGRGTQVDVWNIEESINRGYAVATLYCGDLDPDKPDFSDGVHPHYFKAGQKELGPHDWGTIAAWAWGLQRAVDYLVTDPAINPAQIAVVGHSRLGKTALLAAAFDERIALAIPSQAGCGGTAPSRGKVGESVKRINTAFPHWFNDTFVLFNDQPEKLPFDQNCLVALCAPRPVLFSNAVEDEWANPVGQFDVLAAAAPVYKLLGVEGLAADKQPEPGKLVDSRLGYFIRVGKHSMSLVDWEAYWAFADRHFGRTTAK